MRYNHLEKSIISTIDRIEFIKEQIKQTDDSSTREALRQKLNQLYIMRSYYIQLITKR
jgi:hypothetical protein